jgi:putative SOS response-associated peptidase YedK
MCSIITVSSKPNQFAQFFSKLIDPEGVDARGVETRAHGFLKKEQAPVIFLDSSGHPTVGSKYFSLCPPWAKTWPFEFETYNARMSRSKRVRDQMTGKMKELRLANGEPVEEYIYSVPSFRDAFNNGQTCLVPLSGAVESCYFGESAGHIVRFSPQNGPFIFALGLWNDWVNPESGEVIPTFTLLTDDPDEFVFRHGHDRGLIALDAMHWPEWLGSRRMSGKERFQFIRERRIQPVWRTEIERALKTGWLRKAPSSLEIGAMKVWKP